MFSILSAEQRMFFTSHHPYVAVHSECNHSVFNIVRRATNVLHLPPAMMLQFIPNAIILFSILSPERRMLSIFYGINSTGCLCVIPTSRMLPRTLNAIIMFSRPQSDGIIGNTVISAAAPTQRNSLRGGITSAENIIAFGLRKKTNLLT